MINLKGTDIRELKFKLKVIEEFTPSLDGGTTLSNLIKDLNLETFNPNERWTLNLIIACIANSQKFLWLKGGTELFNLIIIKIVGFVAIQFQIEIKLENCLVVQLIKFF